MATGDQEMKKINTIVCAGSCHCKRVKIAVNVPLNAQVSKCNCSICTKSGYLHMIVDKNDMEILQGSKNLTKYRFNTGVACHLFCSNCGVKVFYIPRSHPDAYSVNVQCLELDNKIQLVVKEFDGMHWEKNIQGLLNQQ